MAVVCRGAGSVVERQPRQPRVPRPALSAVWPSSAPGEASAGGASDVDRQPRPLAGVEGETERLSGKPVMVAADLPVCRGTPADREVCRHERTLSGQPLTGLARLGQAMA